MSVEKMQHAKKVQHVENSKKKKSIKSLNEVSNFLKIKSKIKDLKASADKRQFENFQPFPALYPSPHIK